MKRLIITCLILLMCMSFTNSIYGKTDVKNQRPSLTITKINRSIELTGKLDDPLWQTGQQIELNYEFYPGENTPAPQKTVVTALYDDKNIYFGFHCYDTEPEKIRANLSDRDAMFQDDFVIIVLDTYGDHQKAYELAVNPYGIQGDLMATRTNEDSNFNMVWESAAAINESGWTAEMKIPFKSLRFPKKDIQTWALNISRNMPRNSRIQIAWTPIDRNIPGFLVQSGVIEGLEGIKSSAAIELLPYVMGQQAGNIANAGDPESGLNYEKIEGRAGLGFSYVPGSNFSLDGVVNPDFSQIESDASQISVNTTFAIFYPEKRPFFLKGRELLQTPMYYSRSINDPLAAGRIIGKNGSLSYMYLTAYDRNTVFMIPGEEESSTIPTHEKSFVNIARLRYDLGDESYIGGMILTRNISDGYNYLYGFDWNYKFWGNWSFNGEGFFSQTQELNNPELFTSSREFGSSGYNAGFDGEKYSGTGVHLVLSRNGRNYGFFALVNDFSPTYQSYNGLFSTNNLRQYMLSHSYSFYPQNSFIDRGRIELTGKLQYNHDWNKKEQVIEPEISLTMKGQTNVRLSYLAMNDELFRGVQFESINRGRFNVNSRPLNFLSFGFGGQIGKFIYRTTSPVTGKGHNLNADLTLLPTSKFNISFSYSYSRLSDNVTGDLFYDGDIYRTVLKYQFSPKAFFRTIAEYNSFSESLNIYPLFNYKAGAFTTFYAGITNNFINYGDPFGFTTTNRQYFIKLQYMLRT